MSATQSVCPECLKRIPGWRVTEGNDVYLEKQCPEHGHFRTILWRGPPSFDSWATPERRPSVPPRSCAPAQRGCPYDCGLCPSHRQHTCCVVLEVTGRCNLKCPFCFAAAQAHGRDPDLATIEAWYRSLRSMGGPFNIQLSGGEPTVRDDLPAIVALARSVGFDFVQLNTNGVRIAQDEPYLVRLKQARLSCVFLQFDGISDSVYERLRGARLLEIKKAAIARCAEHGLGVVLVPTVVPGVNTEQLGAILRFALERAPTVRGVHFQPVSYFGRYPRPPTDAQRITLPEVMTGIEAQTFGAIQASHFRPPSAESAHCSFQGTFVRQPDGTLRPSGTAGSSSCCSTAPAPDAHGSESAQSSSCCASGAPGEDSRRARNVVALRWAFPEVRDRKAVNASRATESLDEFIEERERTSFCISGMAFQDAWNLDLERLRDCFLHVGSAKTGLVPFCAYNLTDTSGKSLHRSE